MSVCLSVCLSICPAGVAPRKTLQYEVDVFLVVLSQNLEIKNVLNLYVLLNIGIWTILSISEIMQIQRFRRALAYNFGGGISYIFPLFISEFISPYYP